MLRAVCLPVLLCAFEGHQTDGLVTSFTYTEALNRQISSQCSASPAKRSTYIPPSDGLQSTQRPNTNTSHKPMKTYPCIMHHDPICIHHVLLSLPRAAPPPVAAAAAAAAAPGGSLRNTPDAVGTASTSLLPTKSAI